jgi:hypothetical protein
MRACSASAMFSRTDSSATMPSVLRSSGHSARPSRIASAGFEKADGAAVDLEHAAVGRFQPEQQAREFGAARAEQPAMPTTSPARTRSRSPATARPGPGLRSAARRARLHRMPAARRAGGLRSQFAAEHRRDQRLRAEVRRLPFAHPVAVAQHGDAVRHRIHLVEKVRHEDDREPFAAQAPQHLEQLLTSSSSRLDVGSSRISTFDDTPSARAIATSCCTATE